MDKIKEKKILESRVKSLQLLKKLIKNRPNNVKQIISASAIGIFPNSQEIIFDENSTQKGNTFLANVVKEWEREIESLKAFKINVTTVRIGMVFCELGGIIKVLRLISKSRILSFYWKWRSKNFMDSFERPYRTFLQNIPKIIMD